MSKYFEAAETHYNIGYDSVLELMKETDKSTSGEVFVLLNETTFLLLNSTDHGKLFQALYEDTIISVLSEFEDKTEINIDVSKILNIIPIQNDIPLISEFLDIPIEDTFIFINKGEVLTVVNNLLEPKNISEFNAKYDVDFDDLKNV